MVVALSVSWSLSCAQRYYGEVWESVSYPLRRSVVVNDSRNYVLYFNLTGGTVQPAYFVSIVLP